MTTGTEPKKRGPKPQNDEANLEKMADYVIRGHTVNAAAVEATQDNTNTNAEAERRRLRPKYGKEKSAAPVVVIDAALGIERKNFERENRAWGRVGRALGRWLSERLFREQNPPTNN
jgi:hypothetical protein